MVLAIALFPAVAFSAPRVSSSINPPAGTADDTFTLMVTVRDGAGEDVDAPAFEQSSRFVLDDRGRRSQLRIVNGRRAVEESFIFIVQPDRALPAGTYDLPAGTMRINGVPVAVPPLKLTLEAAADPNVQRRRQVRKGIDFVQVVSNMKPFVGEQITYRAEAATGIEIRRVELSDVDYRGFWRASLDDQRKKVRQIAGSGTTVYTLQEALYPNKPGALEIKERNISIERVVRRPRQEQPWSVFDDVWPFLHDEAQLVTEKHQASPITLDVQPLPAPPVPGYIPVGSLALAARADRREIKETESVTMTIEIVSDGYLAPLELPEPRDGASGFRIYPEKPSVEYEVRGDRVIAKKKFVLAVVPDAPGNVSLPVYRITYFDPGSRRYLTAETPVQSVVVAPDPKRAPQVKLAPPVTIPPPQVTPEAEPEPVQGEIAPLRPAGEAEQWRSVPLSRRPIFPFVALLPPLLALAAIVWMRLLRPISQSRSQAALSPLAAAEKEIDATGALSLDQLRFVVQTYLHRRLGMEYRSRTLSELITVLGVRAPKDGAYDALRTWGEQTEQLMYSGGAVGNAVAPEERERIRALLKQVDHELQ